MDWIYVADYLPIQHTTHLVFTKQGEVILAFPKYERNKIVKDCFNLVWIDTYGGCEIEFVTHCCKIISPCRKNNYYL